MFTTLKRILKSEKPEAVSQLTKEQIAWLAKRWLPGACHD
jgi:uncharacterized protein YecT (DUF1311 family)